MQISTILEALGAACLLVAAAAVDWRAGLFVLGALLIVASFVLGGVEEQREVPL